MKVKFSYHNKNHIALLKFKTLEESLQFAKKFFPQIKSNFSFSYVDQQLDNIDIQTQDDLDIFLNSSNIKHKLLISQNQKNPIYEKVKEDQDFNNQKQKNKQFNQTQQFKSSITSGNEQISQQIHKEFKNKKESFKKKKIKMIQQFTSQQIHKLIPQIINTVLAKIKSNNPDFNIKKHLPIHNNIICNGCNVNPIIGIRYKCSVCNDFDFCQLCQNNIQHNHPFLKIRNPQMAHKYIRTGCEEIENRACNINKQIFNNFNKMGPFKQLFDQFNQSHRFKKHWKEKMQNRNCKARAEKIFRRCKKLATILGGYPMQYNQFVQNNFHLKVKQMIPLLKQIKLNKNENKQFQKFDQNFSNNNEKKEKINEICKYILTEQDKTQSQRSNFIIENVENQIKDINQIKKQTNDNQKQYSDDVITITKKIEKFLGIEENDLMKAIVSENINKKYNEIIDEVCKAFQKS